MLKWGFPQISPITKITVKSPNKVYPNSVYTRIFVFDGTSRSMRKEKTGVGKPLIVQSLRLFCGRDLVPKTGYGSPFGQSLLRDDDAMGIRRMELGFFRFVRGKDSH